MEAEDVNANEFRAYAMKRGLNLGQAEKDYYQNLLLFIVYRGSGRELVFKGGTALAKCYGLNRFSEDIDFTLSGTFDLLVTIEAGLAAFGIPHRMGPFRTSERSSSLKLKIEGPLYRGSDKSLCSVTIEISSRESVLLEPLVRTIGHHMDIIPSFDVYVMREEEIMAEKVRATMTRRSARDMYDLAYLIAKGVVTERDLVDEKLATVGASFDHERFEEACRGLERVWAHELGSLVRNVPPFDEDYRLVTGSFRRFL